MAIKLGLTNENFKWIADEIGCEPEMVIAVSKVECKREPFDGDGFPAILFEKHVFYRNLEPQSLAVEYARKYPDICGRRGYGRGRYGSYDEQRIRFSKAFKLNNQAAMEGCSWGPFQELGENWEGLGFKNVGEMIDTMKNGLYGASVVFIKSIKMRNLNSPMKKRQYALIARRYNGAGYAEFNYDGQIEDQYEIAKKKKIDWDDIEAKPPSQKLKPRWIGDFVDKDVELIEETGETEVEQPNENKQSNEIQDVDDEVNSNEEKTYNPEDTITIVTSSAQKYIPQDIQEQAKEGLITVIKGRAYTWIQFIIGGTVAAFTWFTKEGGWVYAVLLIALCIIGFQLYSWLIVWIKNKDRGRNTELEKLRLELEKMKSEQEHEKVMFEAESAASPVMKTIKFQATPPDLDDVKIGDTESALQKSKVRGFLNGVY